MEVNHYHLWDTWTVVDFFTEIIVNYWHLKLDYSECFIDKKEESSNDTIE